MSERNRTLEIVLAGLLIVLLVGLAGGVVRLVYQWKPAAVVQAAAPEPEPVPAEGYGMVPDFTLINQEGQTVTLADLKGRPWVVDFFFTQCPGRCPMLTLRMSKLQRIIPEGSDARLVSITVDPQRDTPEVLAQHAKDVGAKPDRWMFLTGDQQDIIRLAREGFKLPASENPNDHSQRLTLVDRDGRIRAYFSLDDTSGELERQLQALMQEGT